MLLSINCNPYVLLGTRRIGVLLLPSLQTIYITVTAIKAVHLTVRTVKTIVKTVNPTVFSTVQVVQMAATFVTTTTSQDLVAISVKRKAVG